MRIEAPSFEVWDIQHKIKYFKGYLDDMEKNLKDNEIELEKEFQEMERKCKDNYNYDHEQYLINQAEELREYYNIFYSSFVITIYSYFEYKLNKFCKIAENRSDSRVKLGDIKGRGIRKSRRYLDKVHNFNLPNNILWEGVINIGKIRNYLIHQRGEISNDQMNPDLKKYINQTNGVKFIEAFGVEAIEVKKEYCIFVIKIIEKYLVKLAENNFGNLKN